MEMAMSVPDQRTGGRQEEIADRQYLEFYHGAGVQHIAIITHDIVKTVTELQRRGVNFLTVPTTYYDELQARVGKIDENIDDLKRLGILVDRDDEGYLLQIFTKPVEDRRQFLRNHSAQGASHSAKATSKHSSKRSNEQQALPGNL